MKLVAYLRVSSKTQLDGYGLDVQRKAVKAWARANGHTIVKECVDGAVTGTLDALERPGLACAFDVIRDGGAQGLLIPKLDRLARALAVQEAALAVVWRRGGTVYAADQGEILQDDVDDPMRTALRQMVGVFAELDRRMVVKRLRDGRAFKATQGRHAVGLYPFGSKGATNGRQRDAVPDDGEQRAVERIVELRTAGQSYREVCAALEADGIRPRKAEHWSPATVRKIALRAGLRREH